MTDKHRRVSSVLAIQDLVMKVIAASLSRLLAVMLASGSRSIHLDEGALVPGSVGHHKALFHLVRT